MFSTADTIVAVATPPGRAGLGIVRLSGSAAVRIACALTRRTSLEPRHATVARIYEVRANLDPQPIDEVVVTWFAAPQSYTTEDVVEVSAHGSPPLLLRIVELAQAAGARLAEPGEFTFRAYVHGRLDLVQAEAVADLIDAVTPLQARAAMDQLEGTLTEAIRVVDRQLFDLEARLEASLDFPDEGFHFVTPDQVTQELETAVGAVDALVRDGRAGRLLREGRTVTIVGPPNAGKSTLFNALVGSSRAIVTALPGTTRDLLTERIDLAGFPLTIVDTAGLRIAEDAIEAEGVRRAEEALAVSALALVVLDGSALSYEEVARTLAGLERARPHVPRVFVVNKCDLPRHSEPAAEALLEGSAFLQVSSERGEGLEALRRRIVAELSDREDWRDPPAISNLRHLDLLQEARTGLARAVDALAQGASEEVILVDLRTAREALDRITGRRAPDDLLHHVFSRFCIGK